MFGEDGLAILTALAAQTQNIHNQQTHPTCRAIEANWKYQLFFGKNVAK
jgi:hypothetical protein